MNQKTKYKNIIQSNKSIPLFFQTWWLDATCGADNWDAIVLEKEHGIIAVIPYFVGQKSRFFRGIKQPLLTPFLGFHLFYPPGIRYKQKLSFERSTITALLAALPSHDFVQLPIAPRYKNVLPFYWSQFDVRPRVTYHLPIGVDPWSLLSNSLRREIKKGQQSFSFSPCYDANIVWPLIAESVARQGKKLAASSAMFQRIFDAIASNQQGHCLVVHNNNGQNIAAGFVVWDNQTAYYIARGGQLEALRNGALAALTWELIQQCPAHISTFDFVGSELVNVERFIRNFGAQQTTFYEVRQTSNKLLKLLQLLLR